jgi:hypothetical protein
LSYRRRLAENDDPPNKVAVRGPWLPRLFTAGTADASALDNKFLAAVEQAGISVDNPQAVIQEAKNVCSALDEGYSPGEVATAIKKNSDLTAPQVKSFMTYSANAYCPQHTS